MIAKRVAAWLAPLLVAASVQAGVQDGLNRGNAELVSAGPMAFGPGGILFIGDPQAAAILAVDTEDTSGDPSKASVNVDKLNEKIAALLGTSAEQIAINDLAVNPQSGKVYLSVSRGRGPNALPVILRVDSAGKISEFSLKNVRFAKAALPNAPEDRVVEAGSRRQNNRLLSITDLAFLDNRVVVAGLSNEEFASNLREIPFPFGEVNTGAAIEIYHGNHGQLETRSPVRTFVPISFGGEPQIIAAYTCTPLVRIPLSELKPGAKVRGTTVAELGNRNRPLDIIAYRKGGQNYLLMANDARGVMKISTDGIETREGITQRVGGIAGQPYETVESLKGVTQLDQLNDTHAVILVESEGSVALQTIELP